MSRSFLIAFILLLAIILWMAFPAIFLNKINNEEEKNTSPNLEIKQTKNKEEINHLKIAVYDSHAKKIRQKLTTQGSIEPSKIVHLRSKQKGTLIMIHQEEGAFVKKGDLIYSFDEENLPYKLAAAKADLKLKKAELEASKRLLAKKYQPPIEHIRAEVNFEKAKSIYEEVLQKLKNTKIYAPINGQFSSKTIEVGDFVKENTELGKIVLLSPLKVITYIPQQMIRYIHLGQIATLHIQMDPTNYQAKVTYIEPVANEKTRNFKVELELTNPDLKIYAGQSATLSIPGEELDAHFISPSLLNINEEGALTLKYIDEKTGIVREEKVEIIQTDKDGVWITGLPKEILLISSGQGFLLPGEKIEPEDRIEQKDQKNKDETNSPKLKNSSPQETQKRSILPTASNNKTTQEPNSPKRKQKLSAQKSHQKNNSESIIKPSAQKPNAKNTSQSHKQTNLNSPSSNSELDSGMHQKNKEE